MNKVVLVITKNNLGALRWAWHEFMCDYNGSGELEFVPKMLDDAIFVDDETQDGVWISASDEEE